MCPAAGEKPHQRQLFTLHIDREGNSCAWEQAVLCIATDASDCQECSDDGLAHLGSASDVSLDVVNGEMMLTASGGVNLTGDQARSVGIT
jgi:hypothetical protein